MSKQFRLVQASLVGCFGAALAAFCFAHVDDPKGSVPHPTYLGPGWCIGSCGNEGGIAGGPPVEFGSSGVQLLAWLPVTEFNPANANANTVEGYVSPSGREYAIIGLSHGTGFVEVTDPDSPVIVEFVSCSPAPSSLWRDVRVYQNYCYTVSEGGGGIQVIDMTNIDSGIVTAVGNVTTGGAGATHTMFINPDSGFLYRAGGSGNGLRIYDLANPASPTYVTNWPDKYVHEVTVVSYTEGPYAGKEIAFACGGNNNGYVNTGVYILDVTDVTDDDLKTTGIDQLSYYSYPQSWYCHQGWLSEDKQYFYIDDELDDTNLGVSAQTRIVDISDLSNPTNAGSFTSGAGAIDHNLYVKDGLIYESNYRSGLRVFDAANPTAPVEIAHFDTWPADNNASFNALWDNYPFLPSGIVLGADIEKGLFVWRVGPGQLVFSYPNGIPSVVGSASETILVEITGQNGGVLDPATAMLHYNLGAGFVAVPLEPVKGDVFAANLPAVPCGGQISFYFTAKTTTGMPVQDPQAAPITAYHATTIVNSETVALSDTLETNTGWAVGAAGGAAGDDADTGIWVRVDPNGSAAQPEDDHTPAPGTLCWVTGQGPIGGNIGAADVDGGTTTLTSPIMDATAVADPHIEYARWYSNNLGGAPNADSMPVMISNNGGTTWTQLELVTENAGAWVHKSFRIADVLPPTNQMRLRFIARDLGSGSVVEAAVDDVRIVHYQCAAPPQAGDLNSDGSVDVNDLLILIGAWGPCPAGGPPAECPADINGDNAVDVNDLLLLIGNWS